MENILYKTVVLPAKESEDGESPTILYVTKEANGFMLSRNSFNGLEVIDFSPYSSFQLIEKAVDLGRHERKEIEREKRIKADDEVNLSHSKETFSDHWAASAHEENRGRDVSEIGRKA